VLGVGGTLARIADSGARTSVVIVTDGSSTQYPGDRQALLDKREQAQAAGALLGIDALFHWEFPDMRLDTVAHVDLNGALTELIADGRYDTVFVHHHGDVNVDHQQIFRSTLVAVRPMPGSVVRQVLSYEVNSSTEWGARTVGAVFRPTVYIDIAGSIDRKVAAMESYAGELREYPHPRSREAILDRARLRGHEVGYQYAEAFELILMRG
jgi:LmbE family N-acetylglucosaminyl deacetylase